MIEKTTLAVVLHWGDPSTTKACLRSLAKNKRVDILVVNNTGKPLGLTCREIVNDNNLGFSGGMNLGMNHSIKNGYARTLVLNNDTLADPDLVPRLSEALDTNSRLAAVAPTITYLNDPEKIWFGGGKTSKLSAKSPHSRLGEDVACLPIDKTVEIVDFITGCCVLFDNRALEQVGLFDEDYFLYWEDDDWCARAKSKGWELGHLPLALLRHEVSLGTGTASPDYLYYNIRNHFLFAHKNYSLQKRLIIFMFALGSGSATLIKQLVNGRWRSSSAVLSALTDGLLGKTGKR